MSLLEIEKKLLETFISLHDLLSEISTQRNHHNTDSNAPSANQLFATAIHMAKSKNDIGAAKWMRRAAISGHVRAQYYLGLMFAKGNGLPQSEYHAFTWLSLAESQGSIEAVEAIAKLQKHLCAKQIKDARIYAASLYEQIHDTNYAP